MFADSFITASHRAYCCDVERYRHPPRRPTYLASLHANDEKSSDSQIKISSQQEQYDSTDISSITRTLLSMATFSIGIGVGILVIASVVTSRILYSMLKHDVTTDARPQTINVETESTNRSNRSGGSRTALLALYGRSQAYRMDLPGCTDSLAPELMSRLSIFGTSKMDNSHIFQLEKILTSMCAELSLFSYRFTGFINEVIGSGVPDDEGGGRADAIDIRRTGGFIFEGQVACIATFGNTSLVTTMHIRTRWLDEKVDWFVQSHSKGGMANVIILGSGYDTRAFRMKSLQSDNIRVYEVDAAGTQNEKMSLLQELKQATIIDSKLPSFVSCDFASQSWLERLSDEGLEISYPTLVVWEGVSMYLPISIIKATLKIIAGAGCSESPWYIAFDYLNPKWAYSAPWKLVMHRAQEPFQSAFTTSEMDEVLNFVGLDVVDALSDGKKMQREYATNENGLTVGFMGDYGGFVLAGRPRVM